MSHDAKPAPPRLDGILVVGKPAGPTFRDAQETQKVCDAVLASAQSGAAIGNV